MTRIILVTTINVIIEYRIELREHTLLPPYSSRHLDILLHTTNTLLTVRLPLLKKGRIGPDYLPYTDMALPLRSALLVTTLLLWCEELHGQCIKIGPSPRILCQYRPQILQLIRRQTSS